ncbi:MAG: coenzyme F430 synthase [Methanoregulaceae archaeon]|nr:coenzyme F430 synthase [Methanoregulaceae archaeon]
MKILVLDTIHGGIEIAAHLRGMGHFTDIIDVYRGRTGIDPGTAKERDYDLVVAPVHLDPAYPLFRDMACPVITHHQAVRWIIGKKLPKPFVEVTGARGKTTTASALAGLMQGPGILHTSMGIYRYPGKELIGRRGITPASLVFASREAVRMKGWLVAEVSLGFSGACDFGIITSAEDYLFAGGKRHALSEKVRSGQGLPCVLGAPGITSPGVARAEELAAVDGEVCHLRDGGPAFRNSLLRIEGYRTPLMLAAVAGWMLGLDPSGLASFTPLEGRMKGDWNGPVFIVDNSNSGTDKTTALLAARYARRMSGKDHCTLVIGKEKGAVCEGFPPGDIEDVIADIAPASVILVGDDYGQVSLPEGVSRFVATDLEEGRDVAVRETAEGCVVLAVKSWR